MQTFCVREIVSLIHYQEHFEAFVFNHRIKILFGKTGRNPIKSCDETKTNSHSFNIHSVAATNHHSSSHFGSKAFVKLYIIKSSSTPKNINISTKEVVVKNIPSKLNIKKSRRHAKVTSKLSSNTTNTKQYHRFTPSIVVVFQHQ